jgi:hypothetical protein
MLHCLDIPVFLIVLQEHDCFEKHGGEGQTMRSKPVLAGAPQSLHLSSRSQNKIDVFVFRLSVPSSTHFALLPIELDFVFQTSSNKAHGWMSLRVDGDNCRLTPKKRTIRHYRCARDLLLRTDPIRESTKLLTPVYLVTQHYCIANPSLQYIALQPAGLQYCGGIALIAILQLQLYWTQACIAHPVSYFGRAVMRLPRISHRANIKQKRIKYSSRLGLLCKVWHNMTLLWLAHRLGHPTFGIDGSTGRWLSQSYLIELLSKSTWSHFLSTVIFLQYETINDLCARW